MKDEKEYQDERGSKVIRNSSHILGLEYCEEELRDMANEEYRRRKSMKENREAAASRMLEAMAAATKGTATTAAPATAGKLSINQIALKCVYGGPQITRENCNEEVEKYGHTSGEKLFQRFTFYSSSTNRKGKQTPCTPKKLKNKIELFESIIHLLPKDKQAKVLDEVKILNTFTKTEDQ